MTDTDADPEVLVLRRGIHGIPIESYVAALRDRLPDHDVVLARTPAAERELIADASVVTGMHLDRDLLERANAMEAFMCGYAGTDHLPMEALRERGIAVTNASGVHGPNIGEHVVGAILSFARRFRVARRRAERNEWRHYRTRELQDETVAVVGLGAIGQAVTERLEPFGVETIGVRYTPSKGGPTDRVLGFDEIHEALADAGYVVLACPLTDATRGLVDRDAFVTTRSDAVLVNVARGPVVDTDALVWALSRNRIRGAALDVTDPEPLPPDHALWTFDNVLITPHNAGHTPDYYERLADIVAANVSALEAGDELRNQIQ